MYVRLSLNKPGRQAFLFFREIPIFVVVGYFAFTFGILHSFCHHYFMQEHSLKFVASLCWHQITFCPYHAGVHSFDPFHSLTLLSI